MQETRTRAATQRTGPHLKLRRDKLTAYGRNRGLVNSAQIAAFAGLDPSIVTRLMAGDKGPGEVVVAALLGAFTEATFTDLFEIVPRSNAA
jgi:hypothetical protein